MNSVVWRAEGSSSLSQVGDRILNWILENGGMASFYTDAGPRIVIRTIGGWAHAFPGDRIEKDTRIFYSTDGSEIRNFLVEQ